MNKKGATSISILLLAIMTLALVSFALVTFNVKKNDFEDEINILSYEDIYAKELEIALYLKTGGKLEEVTQKIAIEDGEIRVEGEEIIIKKTYFEDDKKTKEIMTGEYKFKVK